MCRYVIQDIRIDMVHTAARLEKRRGSICPKDADTALFGTVVIMAAGAPSVWDGVGRLFAPFKESANSES